ncbi:MAG: transposase [Spirosomataceae bacterium]
MDSTGLKVYGEGEWKVRKHGADKRRTWRKLHLAIDEATNDIHAVELTTNAVSDADMVRPLLDDIEQCVAKVGGDGATTKSKYMSSWKPATFSP